MSRIAFAAASVAAATLAATMTSPAFAQAPRIQAGELDCSLSSSVGLLVTSQRNVSCFFHGGNGAQAAYVGTLTRLGLDVGVTSGGKMVWTVFVNTDRYGGTLAGSYVGATAEASLALGLGANVLIGGNNDSVALQPLSVQSTTGFNIAAGVSQLNLCLAGSQC
ncbi:MAG TPA: DUF992 domain-containing protein [Xanthobacteraceae bacterium]|nr:DUF992 domain-containing protein [Xanthobacteraceae bacterium]